MIFVTVGTQLPFDRLVEAVDRVAHKLSLQVFAQTGRGTYRPQHIIGRGYINATEFQNHCDSADVVVSHAGIGTILSARAAGKPIILMPRKAALGEHRNDHQLATASKLVQKRGIYVAHTAADLEVLLSRKLDPPEVGGSSSVGLEKLRSYLRDYIHSQSGLRSKPFT